MKKFILLSVLMAFIASGCDSDVNGKKEGSITLYVDNEVIMANGQYAATLTVTVMDKSGIEVDITSDVEIYCEGEDDPMADPRFVTNATGLYSFYAIHGFEISNTVNVKAIDGNLQLPEDPNPSGTQFHHRMLLLQHTGVECPNCPKLMTPLKYLAEDDDYNSLYHHVASHSYNQNDPAYNSDAASLSKNFNVTVYPWLTYNLTTVYELNYDAIRSTINEMTLENAVAGLSANVSYDQDGVYANVSLKAGKDGKYRLAAWLLEDNIRSAQSGADAMWMNVHNNCLRKMNGKNKTECIYGKNKGELQAGACKDFLVAFDLEDDWQGQNCKVILIAVDATDYTLLNCAVCPVGESLGYEYIN